MQEVKTLLYEGDRGKKSEQKLPIPRFFFASVLLSVLTILFVIAIQKKLPPQIPLFYGLPEGEDQLTSKIGLIIPSFFALTITLFNAFLTSLLKNKFLRETLILSSFTISVLSLITTIKIALLVGSF